MFIMCLLEQKYNARKETSVDNSALLKHFANDFLFIRT